MGDLNLSALKQAIDVLDKKEIARKRREFNRLYQEALLSEEPGKGISFTNMLVMLAQHKLIDPDKALK